jgi:hypothetical protein
MEIFEIRQDILLGGWMPIFMAAIKTAKNSEGTASKFAVLSLSEASTAEDFRGKRDAAR